MKFYRIHLDNEAPRIGAGVRYVFAKEGRKYVHLLTPQLERVKMTCYTWNSIKKSEIDLTRHNKKLLHQIIRRRLKYNERTVLVKQAQQLVAGT